jgi:GNAT superfamily N-acetyltransferase
MLDKSIEHYRIILKRLPGTPLPKAELPTGYRLVTYQEGDEQAWGEIEASVLEFETVGNAVKYYQAKFVPYLDEIKRRTLFVQKEDGEKVGTFTAWWNYTGRRRHPFMHWVAVKPEYQGIGLGKALIAGGVELMVEIEGDCEMYIPTQTWSHRAIKLYRWAGFEFETGEPAPGGFPNQTAQGMALIKDLI